MAHKPQPFAVWVTGLPASGKSTIVKLLSALLAERGIDAAILESDALRAVFTPHPRYDRDERDTFYRQIAYVGFLLAKHGVPVVFDATANLRVYRDRARRQIPRFLEVYVDCPLEVCIRRDPKGIYRAGREGSARIVPGLQEPYEPPLEPDVHIHAESEAPELAARKILDKLIDRGFLEA